jgi:DNA-binding HxlR family transcriptional regulator
MTAQQRREESAHEHNAFMAHCPTRQVLATIGDKWAGLLVNALAGGPRRHGELRTRIAGASQKMLTQTLRTLERDGLVTRTVTPSVPVRVDYELTDLGRTLLPVLSALKTWSETHFPEIETARAAYDARPVTAGGA